MYRLIAIIVMCMMFQTSVNAQCSGCDYFNTIPGGSLVVSSGEKACFSGTASYSGSISVNNGGILQICGVNAELSLSNGVSLFPGARMEIYDCAKLIQFGSFADFGTVATFAYCSDCGDPTYTSDTAVQTVGSRWFTGWVCDATLPVEMIEFYAAVNNSEVKLNWKTATEINNAHFEVEFSLDGFNWVTRGYVVGSGNSTVEQSYSFSDYKNESKKGYYRLKQVDLDGRFDYTDVIMLNSNNKGGISLSQVQGGNVRVNIDLAGDVVFKVFSVSGQLVAYNNYINSTTEGKFIVELNSDAYESGVYLVQVENENQTYSEKFVVH